LSTEGAGILKTGNHITAAAVLIIVLSAGVFSTASGSAALTAPSALELKPDESENRGRYLSVFNSETTLQSGISEQRYQILRLEGERIISPGSMPEVIEANSSALSGSRRKNMAISILASAVLPGLGEMYMYTRTKEKSILGRAIGLMAAEAYLWYGYFDNHDRGKDFKRQYEEYGDAHWSRERFLQNHPVCYTYSVNGCDSWQQYNELGSDPDTPTEYFYFYYTAKSVDREEYYENMGKYDAFLYGWDDWNGEYLHEGGDPNYWTPHSNKYLLRADYHIMGMIATRVVSMVHAGWIAYSRGGTEPDWSLRVDKTLLDYRCSLNYRF
jgi:hypothetical protein